MNFFLVSLYNFLQNFEELAKNDGQAGDKFFFQGFENVLEFGELKFEVGLAFGLEGDDFVHIEGEIMLELLEIPLVEMNGGGNLLENGDVGQFFHWLSDDSVMYFKNLYRIIIL